MQVTRPLGRNDILVFRGKSFNFKLITERRMIKAKKYILLDFYWIEVHESVLMGFGN